MITTVALLGIREQKPLTDERFTTTTCTTTACHYNLDTGPVDASCCLLVVL